MRPMRPMTPRDPQWPLGLPPRDEKAQGYVIPSGNHHEWPLEPPRPLEPKEPKDPQWPISLPEVPEVPDER